MAPESADPRSFKNLPEEEQNRLLHRFLRADAPRPDGTGIGRLMDQTLTELRRLYYWWDRVHPGVDLTYARLMDYLVVRHNYSLFEAEELEWRQIVELLQADADTIDASGGESDPAKPTGKEPPKTRGRKKADSKTMEHEATLAEEWEKARDADVYKPDFATDNGMTQKDLDKLLDRVAARKRRSDK